MRVPPLTTGTAYLVARSCRYTVEKDSTLNIFSWSGFTSCTSDPATSLGLVDTWGLNAVFMIHSGSKRLRAMKIDQWSQYPEEKEVLFDVRDCLFLPSFFLNCKTKKDI